MHWRRRLRACLPTSFLILMAFLLLSCSSGVRPLEPARLEPALPPEPRRSLSSPEAIPLLPDATPLSPTTTPRPPAATVVAQALQPFDPPVGAGEPAGCLSLEEQASLGTRQAMLDYAGSLVPLRRTFFQRSISSSWNVYTGQFTRDEHGVVSLSVDDASNQFIVQRMLNALHVAGFVTWLRRSPDQGLHILALPLLDPTVLESSWAPYIHAYWQDRQALPAEDSTVIATLKLPPCAWMAAQGFAPEINADWWAEDVTSWPDYASAAEAYLADTYEEAAQVACGIDWLGSNIPVGPETMCGPLVWSILNDAGAFPPGWGEWRTGPKSFWLAKPSSNGRPWSLFPQEMYSLYSFKQPMGAFDFSAFPLYPGDFLYLYSRRDGFDHMLLVTEVDEDGNVFTVSNIVRVEPEEKTTIERRLLISMEDPTAGIARNQWANDRINGRTGHAGFEVFRWAWLEKDVTGTPMVYTIQPGDTFRQIATLWKTPAWRIAEYNDMVVTASLQVGQELLIPPNQPAGR